MLPRRAVVLLAGAVALAVAVVLALRAPRSTLGPGPARVAALSGAPAAARSAGAARPIAQAAPVRLVPTEPVAPSAPAPNGAFEGRVVSAADGRPVPGAQLTFARAEEASSLAASADGAFRFAARVPGRWALAAVTAPGFLPFAPAWGASPVSLEARPGEVVRGVTVTLAPEVRYQGLVVDEKGAPVAGAEVRVLGERRDEAVVPLLDRFTSDAEGRFSFAAPEDALLEARKAGFAPARERVSYAVRVTGRLTLRLTATQAALHAIAGIVEDPAGAPLSGALLAGRAQAAGDEATARTGADGRFRLEVVAPGTWSLTAERAGFAPAATTALAGSSDVRIRLAAGGRIEGQVRHRATGQPVAPFSVVVQSVTLRTVSVVDPGGRYALEDLAPGTAVLSVVAPGYAPSSEVKVPVPAPGAAPALADFDLAPGGRLAGSVLSRASKKPVAGARVEVEGMPSSLGIPVRLETVADNDGRFELAGVSEQGMSLFASGPGHHARVLSVPGVPSGELGGPVELELTPLEDGEEPRVELAGIGASLGKDGEVLRVMAVLPGGGAAEAGLGPGDEIVAIDGASVAKMTMMDAIPRLRGPEGTTVAVDVVKAGDAARSPRRVVVPRRMVRG